MSPTKLKQRRPDGLAQMLAEIRSIPGAPLPGHVREDVELRTGTDLRNVRVHTTPEAARHAQTLGARAFTFGEDVVVGRGADLTTIQHEAMHAAQFARHGAPSAPTGVAASDHPAHIQAESATHTDSGHTVAHTAALTSPGGLIQRQQVAEQEKKKAPVSLVGDLARDFLKSDTGKLAYAVMPPGLAAAAQVLGAGAAFTEAFLRVAIASLTEADAEALKKQFSSFGAYPAFSAGSNAGVVVGAAEDIASNLQGLWEIVKVAGEFVTQPLLDTAMYLYDKDLFLQVKREEAEHARKVIAAIWAFAKKVSSDPAFLIEQGEAMGAACGEMASAWFHTSSKDHQAFIEQSPLKKGYTVGRGLGMAAMEVALLFLGPEEWIARGAIAVGRVVKGSRLYKVIAEILEKIPEIARLFKAKTELDDAHKALKAARKVDAVGKVAEEAGQARKALGAAGDVPKDVHAPRAPEVHAPQPTVEPTIKPKVETPRTEPPKIEPAKVEPTAQPKVEPPKAEPAMAKAPEGPKPTEPTTPVEPGVKPAEPPKAKEAVAPKAPEGTPKPAADAPPPIAQPQTATGSKSRVEAQQDVLGRRAKAKDAADLKSSGKTTAAQASKIGVTEAADRLNAANATAAKARVQAEAAREAARLGKSGSKSAARTAASEQRAAEKTVREAERNLARAQRESLAADKSALRANTTAKNREAARNTSRDHLKKVEHWEANPNEAPRLKRGEPFDPKKRRPNFEEYPDVPATAVDRHAGVRTNPDARVGVFKEQVPAELRQQHDELAKILLDPKSGQKERAAAGHEFEKLMQKDIAKGEAPRVRHTAGDKERIGDVGIHEVTVEQAISPGKFDQTWRDLIERDYAIITVPKLDPASEQKLSKMAAIYEKLTGRRPMITVRETLP